MLGLLLASRAQAGDAVYRWTDSAGRVHYTNEESAVPRSHRQDSQMSTSGISAESPTRQPAICSTRRLVQHHVRGLEVPVHQSLLVGFIERAADLAQDEDDAGCRLRTERRDERLQADAVEQLHHVVETAVLRGAEIVEIHGVGRLQPAIMLASRRNRLMNTSACRAEDAPAGFTSLIAAGRASI